MYREEELYKKLEGHIDDKDLKLVKSIVDDIDRFNESDLIPDGIELYIDFDDVDHDSEYNTYETFFVRMLADGKDIEMSLVDMLSVKDLDNVMCAIESTYEEIDNWKLKMRECLTYDIKNDLNARVLTYYAKGGIKREKIDDFVKEPLLKQLKKLGLDSMGVKKSTKESPVRDFVNNIALVTLLKHYANRCDDLEYEVTSLEEKLLVTKI